MFTGETVASSDQAPSHDIRHFIDEKPIASPSGDGGQSTSKSAGRSLPDVENISLPEGKFLVFGVGFSLIWLFGIYIS